MKKMVFIVIGLLSLIGCVSITDLDHIEGTVKVENRVKVYIDNLSSNEIIPTIYFGESSTCGGITIEKNTTGSFIEVDFSKDTKAENGEPYAVALYVTTSGSAIRYRYSVSEYNKRQDGIYMKYPRPRMIIKDSQSTESAFKITRESY